MKKQPIGFMDSGVGGLTLVKEARKRLPNEDMVFIGDQARLPYGEKPAATVREFAWQMANFLRHQEIKALVIACNTATAAALPDLQAQLAIPVIGVIKPGSIAALQATQNQHVGVIATTGTIQSAAYSQQIAALNPDVQVTGLAAPQFVTMIEANQRHGQAVQTIVNQILQPLQQSKIDTLVLGCTHFPLLTSAIQTAVGPDVTLVNPAVQAITMLAEVLKQQQQLATTTSGTLRMYTTGAVAGFEEIAQQWLAQTDLVVQQVDIQKEKNDGPDR